MDTDGGSPRAGVGPTDLHHSNISPSCARSSQGALQAELQGNVLYSDTTIFTRSGVDEVPEHQCVACPCSDTELQASKTEPRSLVSVADVEDSKEVEYEMDPHLYRVLEHIETSAASEPRTHQPTLASEGWTFPPAVPGLTPPRALLEWTRRPDAVQQTVAGVDGPFVDTLPVRAVNHRAGNIQFTAYEILRHEILRSVGATPHEVWHDIESFIWVLCYVVLQRLAATPSASQKAAAQTNLHVWFGGSDIATSSSAVRDIAPSRTSSGGPLDVGYYGGMLSARMAGLYRRLALLVRRGEALEACPVHLDHDSVLAALEEASGDDVDLFLVSS
ncbi:hypothetical protein PLICRDRAFT_45848 [Plicaturopsis crispa FD-325 SS-3]|uniref:Fungal-type protein kinase domain-containing protein n=1 Tax=Plicaturopsis crispa FD-325 SS-3 TaxID=944288 RepID=A0A0C9T6M7_PLICR|nr:hypothetical protein PLICRDRAFT_45848 [Plicaturopsis crispa FD-325 SS-3]